MDPQMAALVCIIILALIFDYINGFHDAANSIATVVSTRVLTPGQAVAMAAFFNFVAFMVFPLGVAKMISDGILQPGTADNAVITATLIGACGWNLITWYLGLPSSSSHALVGGLVGAGLFKAGPDALVWYGIGKTCLFIIVAPIMGFTIGIAVAIAVAWIFRRATPRKVKGIFQKGQMLSAAFYSLGHGGNDAQKTMGIIFMLLVSAGHLEKDEISIKHSIFELPPWRILWVVLACHAAMGLGTLSGGWRIVKTMGQKLSKLRPVDGFCAEMGAALTLVLTAVFGIPVSTTHTITSGIIGVGAIHRVTGVRWGVAGQIVWAWILTIPGAALISGISWAIIHYV